MKTASPLQKQVGHLQRHFRKYLLAGLFLILPIGITLIILRFLITITAGGFVSILSRLWPHLSGILTWIISIGLMGIFVYGLGLLTAHVIGRKMVAVGEKIILQIPLFKTIYSVSKQVVDTFSMSGKASFNSVVLIEFPRPGTRSIGFVTGTIPDERGELCYKVFIPTTPNPTTGYFLIIHPRNVQKTGIPVEEGLKMVVSGGIVGPSKIE